MTWRNDPITDKQKRMISEMQEDAGMNGSWIPPFNGTTKGDACDYIHDNLRTVYRSFFTPHEEAGDRV